MKLGLFLLILHDVIEKLVGMGLLTSAGDFVGPSLQQDFDIAVMVEQCAKARGVLFQDDLDRILNALPLVLNLLGKR